MNYIITLAEGCEPLLSHALDLAKDFHKVLDQHPARTAKTRRDPKTYMIRTASTADGSTHWDLWAYHTKQGVHVGMRKTA